jgi:hypothetical protein
MNGKTYSRAAVIGKNFLNILNRLHRDFTLGYFGNNISTAQKEYRKFVNLLFNEEYKGLANRIGQSRYKRGRLLPQGF